MKIITPSLPARLLATTIALALPVAPASALTELEAINVTATRTARTVDETLAAVTIITREEIERLQDRDLITLLDGQPGLTISRNGGLGKSSGIRLRGTGSGHALVLIDGLRIGSATTGQTAFEHLPLAQIDRIEIVRGPASHLYGADAIGGVIQIFTRKGETDTRIHARAGYGAYNTRSGTLGVSGAEGDADYNLELSRLASDGFSARKENNPDRDGYRNRSVSARVGYRLGDRLRLEANLLRATGNSEYDGWTATRDYSADFIQQSIGGRLEYAPTDWWDLTLTLGESRDESTHFTDGSRSSFFDTVQRQASWQNDFFIGDRGILTLGADFRRDKVDGSSSYSRDKRDDTGLFAQYQATLGAHNLTLALRHDDNDAFENRTTGNIAWGYRLSPRLQINAAYGTAFKAPTFNDLYYQDPWGSSGDPDLTPEKSTSVELGLKGATDRGRWELNLFRTRIVDLISWIETPPGSWTYRPQNIDQALIKGLEASIRHRLAGWEIAANLTLLDPRNRKTDKLLVRRHKRTLRIDIDRHFGDCTLGATLQARSHSFNDTANTQRVGGFGVVTLRASHRLTPNWHLQARVDNLFNKQYETIRGYNTSDQALFVSLSYRSK